MEMTSIPEKLLLRSTILVTVKFITWGLMQRRPIYVIYLRILLRIEELCCIQICRKVCKLLYEADHRDPIYSC
ncbi:hypothetical protein D3C78_1857890 [compost metagenome]